MNEHSDSEWLATGAFLVLTQLQNQKFCAIAKVWLSEWEKRNQPRVTVNAEKRWSCQFSSKFKPSGFRHTVTAVTQTNQWVDFLFPPSKTEQKMPFDQMRVYLLHYKLLTGRSCFWFWWLKLAYWLLILNWNQDTLNGKKMIAVLLSTYW